MDKRKVGFWGFFILWTLFVILTSILLSENALREKAYELITPNEIIEVSQNKNIEIRSETKVKIIAEGCDFFRLLNTNKEQYEAKPTNPPPEIECDNPYHYYYRLTQYLTGEYELMDSGASIIFPQPKDAKLKIKPSPTFKGDLVILTVLAGFLVWIIIIFWVWVLEYS